MDIRNLSIVTPIQLNWRLVAPRDYEHLEYFITPDLSLVFNEILVTAAEKDQTVRQFQFRIGAYLMGSDAKKEQFMNEILPHRSKERIENAFKNEEISVFFSMDEAKELELLFQNSLATCRRMEIHFHGRAVQLSELPQDDFNLVVKRCIELRVVSIFDFEKHGESFQDVHNELRENLERVVRREVADKEFEKKGITKKKLTIKGALGTACLTISAVAMWTSRKLISGPGWWRATGSIACAVASVVVGALGKKLTEETVEYMRKGVIAAYV